MYTYVVIRKLLYYMKFGRVSATPYCNYSLQCILLLDVFCSTLWNLEECKILFPVAIICMIYESTSDELRVDILTSCIY